MDETGITQDGLAQSTGINQGTVSRYVNAKVLPDWDTLLTLARAFKRPIIYFITDNDAPARGNGNPKPESDIDSGEVYRNIVEGNTEYVLILRSVLEEKYRLVALEQIQSDIDERKSDKDTISRLMTLVEVTTGRIADLHVKFPQGEKG